MYFRLLHDEASASVSYLLADRGAAEAVLIDPRPADLPLLAAMLAEHRLRLRWVLRTHVHAAERPVEVRRALATLGAPVVAGGGQVPGLLDFGDEHLAVLATPGHTADSLSFRWRDRLFCGGLLAVGGCPAQPRPADPPALWASVVQQVFTLPDETLLFAGHARDGRITCSVLEARRWHPWFAGGGSRDDVLARVVVPAGADPDTGPRPLPHQRQELPSSAADSSRHPAPAAP